MNEQVFIINEEVIFWSERRVLCRYDGKVNPVYLNDPSAKCLSMLITASGLVTQKELYEFAWNDGGAKITPNNLYQNISLIRRAINLAFMRKISAVITSPRKGFFMSSDISVSSQEISRTELDNLVAIKKDVVTEKLPTDDSEENYQSRMRSHGLALVVFITLLIISCGYLFIQEGRGNGMPWGFIDNYFERYEFYGEKGKCKIFFPKKEKNPELRKEIFNTYLGECDENPYHFISFMKAVSGVSSFSCKPLKSERDFFQDCETLYYQGNRVK